MKLSSIFYILLLFITSTSAIAETYRIKRLTPIKIYGSFLLRNSSGDEIRLDCSSFFHNLTIETKENEFVYYLDVYECADYYNFYYKPTFEKRCLTHDSFRSFYHYCD